MASRKPAEIGSLLWRWFVHRKMRTTMPMARRRAATALGAVMLAVVALVFARSADAAQSVFRRLVAEYPWAPLALTPVMFAAVAFATERWAGVARGSGIP